MKCENDFSPPTLPEGYYSTTPARVQQHEVFDYSRLRTHWDTRIPKHQLVARIFPDGKIVLWLPNEPSGFSYKFKTYNEAREYLETILGLGLIYENMPEIFTRR